MIFSQQIPWSGHLYRDDSAEARELITDPAAKRREHDWAELREGTLGYAMLDCDQRVRSLIPVHIARFPYSNSPLDQLHPSLCPATVREELSAADRVFGWVPEKGNSRAHRGQVRLHRTVCLASADEAIKKHDQPLPLAILSNPKPKQVGFYLAEDEAGAPFTRQELNYADFAGKSSPRGAKVYPHHHDLPEQYWEVPANAQPTPAVDGKYREYLRAGRVQDSQNWSIKEWVNPGTEFRFRIQITNLNAEELGALIWLLQLDTDERPYYFRFGGGKPLGFGSLRVRIENTQLAKGNQYATAWQELKLEPTGPADDTDTNLLVKLVNQYKTSLVTPFFGKEGEFKQLPMIAGLLRAGRGWDDNAPLHYPRRTTEPQTDGRNYEWFNPPQPLPSITSNDRLTRR